MSIKTVTLALLASFNLAAAPQPAQPERTSDFTVTEQLSYSVVKQMREKPSTANIAASVEPAQISQGLDLTRGEPSSFLTAEQIQKRNTFYQCEDKTENCWTAEEKEAAVVMETKIALVVGVLKCSQDNSSQLLKDYNSFIKRNAVAIRAFEAVAIQHFVRQTPENPRKGDRNYDKFTTEVANLYSLSSGDKEAYCASIAWRLGDTRELKSPEEIASYSYKFTQHPKP